MKELGQGRPEAPKSQQEGPPPKEQAKPQGESGLSRLLDEKRLFAAWAPKGRDPDSYPIEAMKQIQSEVTERIQRQYDAAKHFSPLRQSDVLDAIIIDKLWDLKISIYNVERAYEIIAYPICKNQELKISIKKDLEKEGHMGRIELNEEELEAIGKMTTIRGIPFDPEKRVYAYYEVPGYTSPMFRRHLHRCRFD